MEQSNIPTPLNNTEISENNLSENPSGIQRFVCFAMCILLASGLATVSHFALWELAGFLMSILFAACFSQMLQLGGKLCTVIPVYGFVAAFIRAFNGQFEILSLLGFINLIFPTVAAIVLFVCAQKKSSKSVTFAALSTVYTAFAAVLCLFLAGAYYGSLNLSVLQKAVADFSTAIGNVYGSLMENALLSVSPEKTSDISGIIESFKQSMVLSVRASLPSLFISFGMFVAVLTNAFYKYSATWFGTKAQYFSQRKWRFEVSAVSVGMFYISYLIYVICSLFSVETVIYAAFMNVISILTYPFAYLGLRFLYSVLCVRLRNRAASVLVLAAAFFALSLFLGAASFLMTLLAFIGASSALRISFWIKRP